MSSDICICCGHEIPGGRQVCPVCEERVKNVEYKSQKAVPKRKNFITKLRQKIQRAI